jgi:hypothetical protein
VGDRVLQSQRLLPECDFIGALKMIDSSSNMQKKKKKTRRA